MLVLSRKPDEEIVFPELNIIIKIVSVKNNGTVRIGINAPNEVSIVRRELLDRGDKNASNTPTKKTS
jgi:carbon storage regulator